jgi:transcription-repair coupling factor (superfamily II helicase)
MRTNVDVLSMSATPIPRTLEMAVTGIREMSTIQTPPEERHPVLTFVGAYEEKTISAALRRELLRDGQVFYVHNRVQSIDRAASKIRDLVPEARVAVAHGQMNEHALEQVIIDFWEKRFDVLVCTTIVETGLDISNANTLVVERADVLGLSQLHQLRGRVGRGEGKSRCILIAAGEPEAVERLRVLCRTQDGFEIARADLRLRGMGDFFGARQHGLPEFRFFDVEQDDDLLTKARSDALVVLDADPELQTPGGQRLRLALARRYAERERLYEVG